MNSAHQMFAEHYKQVRLRMGMEKPTFVTLPQFEARPARKVANRRILKRQQAAHRNAQMLQLLKNPEARVPREMFGLFSSIRPAPVAEIQRIVAEHFEMTTSEMLSPSRKMNVSFARQIAIYLARLLSRNSLCVLGHRFGDLDHTTVLHAIRRVEARIEESDAFAATVSTLRHKIVGNDVGVYYGA